MKYFYKYTVMILMVQKGIFISAPAEYDQKNDKDDENMDDEDDDSD